jgi:hypothetical protein
MLLDDIKTVPDSEIIEKGARALINELGYTGYIKFMRMFEHGNGNYLNVQDEIFKNMSIREISDSAMKHWDDTQK